ncbi:MAG: hypothetical protein HYS17_09550 [Micavibrio aeruginosavorus]|uniref:Uncharacterized protein n=1 Tax=Micavibrio aeruginosavorus TaxID=349221 RepID=A0A7T5R1I8_9BACT|nr:MAG: hypothetical protein HYS17_09550 [Micavibrio aeruginosavorus]
MTEDNSIETALEAVPGEPLHIAHELQNQPAEKLSKIEISGPTKILPKGAG